MSGHVRRQEGLAAVRCQLSAISFQLGWSLGWQLYCHAGNPCQFKGGSTTATPTRWKTDWPWGPRVRLFAARGPRIRYVLYRGAFSSSRLGTKWLKLSVPVPTSCREKVRYACAVPPMSDDGRTVQESGRTELLRELLLPVLRGRGTENAALGPRCFGDSRGQLADHWPVEKQSIVALRDCSESLRRTSPFPAGKGRE
jgi:hypothetical protein